MPTVVQLRKTGHKTRNTLNGKVAPPRHVKNKTRRTREHLTPDEVYARVHAKNPAISRATIYRTLDFLCELRLVVAMQWGGQMYYEAAGEQPHHHLVCHNCGSIEQIDHSMLSSLFAAVDKKYRFSIDMDHLGLFGLCAVCRKVDQRMGNR